MNTQNQNRSSELATDALNTLIEALEAGNSEALKSYLAVMARFHQYSWNNCLLIAFQRPGATHVAGFHTWHKFGRYVRKGEKGITILAPVTQKREMKDDQNSDAAPKTYQQLVGFRTAFVFDVAQTDGNDLPKFATVKGDAAHHVEILKSFAQMRGIEIRYDENIAPAKGISYGGRISIMPDLTSADEVATLYVMRFLLGVAEAGFFPGILLYLTYWFRRNEQAQMIALFMVAIPVSNIIGAPVSGFILDHVHWLAIASWRWLLMLEGLPAIIGGVVTYLLLPSRPIEARFLSAREKDWIMNAIADEQSRKMGGRLSALRVLAHGRVWHLACVSLAFNIGSYAFIFWMPQAARLLSKLYSNTTVGMLVMIPYLAGLAAMILVSRSSDRKRERRYHVAIPSMLTGIALLSLGATSSPLLSTALWSLAYIGIAGATAPLFSIPCDLLGGAAAASGIALFNSIGSLGGFFGSSLVGAAADRQGGIYRGLAMAAVSFFVLAVLILMLPKRSSGLRAAQA